MRQLIGVFLFLSFHAPGAQADGLGRLFFTPEQRAQLDREHAPAEDSLLSALTLNGIVQRSDGSRTVWVNGMAQNANGSHDHAPAIHRIAVRGKQQPGEIKVGQRLLLEQPAAK